MIDKVDNNNILNTQNTLQESQAAQGILAQTQKNNYLSNKNTLIDESNISQTAVELYQHEQEINQYAKYLDGVSEEDANKQVLSLMEKGVIDVSDEELADSMFQNLSLLNKLFN